MRLAVVLAFGLLLAACAEQAEEPKKVDCAPFVEQVERYDCDQVNAAWKACDQQIMSGDPSVDDVCVCAMDTLWQRSEACLENPYDPRNDPSCRSVLDQVLTFDCDELIAASEYCLESREHSAEPLCRCAASAVITAGANCEYERWKASRE
jgi:hypothetical protein